MITVATPRMSGAQSIAEAEARNPDMAVIWAAGHAELPTGADAAVQLLSKPFASSDLAAPPARAGKTLSPA